MTQISAGLDGHATGLGADGQVYMRLGCTDESPAGNAWSPLTDGSTGARFRQVSRGDCQTYAINILHEILRRTGCTASEPAGTDWEQIGGQLMWISVGHGPVLWGVDYGHDVWYKQLGDPEFVHKTTEQYWKEILPLNQNMFSLDVGRDGHVWAVDRSDQVYWRAGIDHTNPDLKDGTSWVTSTSVYTQGDQGEDVNTDTDFGKAHQVVICTNGQAWARTLDDQLAIRTGVMEERIVGSGW